MLVNDGPQAACSGKASTGSSGLREGQETDRLVACHPFSLVELERTMEVNHLEFASEETKKGLVKAW